MAGIYLSDEEMKALIGAPALVQRLYVFGIRPSMSFGTGMVGVESSISWHGLAREVRVEAAPGIKEELPSKQQVRRAAQHLVKRGLISECSKGLQLIFKCHLARLNSDAQKKADTKPTHQAEQKPTHLQSTQGTENKGVFEIDAGKADTVADTPNFPNPTHIGVSELTTTTTTTTTTAAATDRFAMYLDWQPSNVFPDLCRRSGLNPEDANACLGGFISHYLSTPGRTENQARWDSLLINWMQRDRAKAQGRLQAIGGRNYGPDQSGASKPAGPAQRAAELAAATRDESGDWLSEEYDQFA